MKRLAHFFGIEPDTTGHTEKLVSGLGGFVSILMILLASYYMAGRSLSHMAVPLIVASMGASAVLLFAAPQGRLSQPWNLIGGHVISAIVGVTCAKFVPEALVAGPLAVGLAITAMYYLGCIHPPGGATALVAVVGGDAVHRLGYIYVVEPILANVLVIFAAALLFNLLFAWRRYPAALHHWTRVAREPAGAESAASGGRLEVDDFEYALRKVGSFVDVTEEELEAIFRLAMQHSSSQHLPVDRVYVGHYYSNGEYGADWAVRQVVDESSPEGRPTDMVIYKTVAGQGRRSTGSCSREEFAMWASYEVILNENSWQKVERGAPRHAEREDAALAVG